MRHLPVTRLSMASCQHGRRGRLLGSRRCPTPTFSLCGWDLLPAAAQSPLPLSRAVFTQRELLAANTVSSFGDGRGR